MAPKNVLLDALKASLRCGLTEEQFWNSTPYMTRLHCDAAVERDRNAYRHAMFIAWHAAAFGRIKRLPSFSKAMKMVEGSEGNKSVQRQSPDEILRAVEMITIKLGGTDKRKRVNGKKRKN